MGRYRPNPESQPSSSCLLHSSQPTRLMILYPKLRVIPLQLEVLTHTGLFLTTFSPLDHPHLHPETSSSRDKLFSVFLSGIMGSGSLSRIISIHADELLCNCLKAGVMLLFNTHHSAAGTDSEPPEQDKQCRKQINE